jgi:hypothetical protein
MFLQKALDFAPSERLEVRLAKDMVVLERTLDGSCKLPSHEAVKLFNA